MLKVLHTWLPILLNFYEETLPLFPLPAQNKDATRISQQNSTAELSGGHSEYDVESPKTQQPFKEVLTEPWCDPIKISSDDNNNINN